jgi:cytochrome c oxidase subunit 3
MKNISNIKKFQFFPFHLVTPSPWPILVSFSMLNMTTGAVAYFHGYYLGGYILTLGFITTVFGMTLWFKDVITESTLLGDHTKEVVVGLVYGIVLFIVSEACAFLSIFWAFFHSSLSPAIELGGVWPPLGIEPLNPFAIPLLNTLLLLSSGATITFGHHALLASKRDGAIFGTLLTIILAIIFTALQGFEYAQSSVTIADSVFGSAFFCGTGLHGYMLPLSIKINLPKKSRIFINNNRFTTSYPIKQKTLTLLNKNKEYFNLEKNFLEWLSGFTDSEGNFSITLRNKNLANNLLDDNNSYSNVTLTFQIGLHLDDLKVLELIKKNLQCGKISISKVNNRCNFFVNDAFSLINFIVPIFYFVKLNSSKYSQFQVFEKAVKLLYNKTHLTVEGKNKMIDLKKSLNKEHKLPDFINITDAWLLGFIEGDGSFSTSGLMPRLKFENHIKELKLLQEIQNQNFIGFGSLTIKTRKERGLNENPTAVLEINKISILKKFVDKYEDKNSGLFSFKTKKYYDFKDWSIIVNLYYLGYHLLPEGKSLILKLKSRMNNYRLSTNLNKEKKLENLDIEINKLFAMEAPYEIKNGIRLYTGTNKWVSDSIKIIAIDNFKNELFFDSITQCSLSLKISRSKIKKCIVEGKLYKNFSFKLNLM